MQRSLKNPFNTSPVAACAAALLLASVLAGCVSTSDADGMDTLLTDEEIPEHMHNCIAGDELLEFFGLEANPGQVDIEQIIETSEEFGDNTSDEDAPIPDEGYIQFLSSKGNATCEEGPVVWVFLAVYADDNDYQQAVARQQTDWEEHGSCDFGIEMWGGNQVLTMHGFHPAFLTTQWQEPDENWTEEDWEQWGEQMASFEEPSKDDLQATFQALKTKNPGMESPC